MKTVKDFIEVTRRTLVPLREGERKVQNVGGKWYVQGGSFCSHCKIAYNFERTLELLLEEREKGFSHGLPRCDYCGKSLRCRSKPNNYSGFWKKLKEMELV